MKSFLFCCLLVLTGVGLYAYRSVNKDAFLCDVTQNGPIAYVNALGDVNLKFYTNPTEASGGPNSFSYEWIFTYDDNSTSWSYNREPYIPVPCNNTIKHVYVKVSSASCFKEFNRSYNPGICGTEGLAAVQTGTASSGKVK
jgi:hypothetical protein